MSKKEITVEEFDACKSGVRGVDYMVGWDDKGVLDVYAKVDELIQDSAVVSRHLLKVMDNLAEVASEEDFFVVSELHRRFLVLRGNLVSLRFSAKKIGGWTFI